MKAFSNQQARQLAEAIIEAESILSRYLYECFPIGANCGVLLSSVQQNPTPATIIATSPNCYGGEVTVEIHTGKQGRRRFRRVPARVVSDVRPTPTDAGHQEGRE